MAESYGNTAMASILTAAVLLSIILNISFLITTAKRKRLNNGMYVLLSACATLDLSFGNSSAVISIIVLFTNWSISGSVCRLQSYLFTFTQMTSAFLLAALSLERMAVLVKPSRHSVIFVSRITMLLIFGIVIFTGIVSSIHLYGTISINWQSQAYKCGADFTESKPLLDFTFSIDHAVPFWVVSLPATVISFAKLLYSRQKCTTSGEIILEKNSNVVTDSYAKRIQNIHKKCRGNYGKSTKKGFVGSRVFTNWGYDEPEHWDSDYDDTEPQNRVEIKRVYFLPRTDCVMLISATVVVFVTWLFWFPWVVLRFIWNYSPYETYSQDFAFFGMFCMHLNIMIKPLLMLALDSYYRAAFFKTFICQRKKLKLSLPEAD